MHLNSELQNSSRLMRLLKYREGTTIGLQNHTTSMNPKPGSNMMWIPLPLKSDTWFSTPSFLKNGSPWLNWCFYFSIKIGMIFSKNSFHHLNKCGVGLPGVRIHCCLHAKSTKKIIPQQVYYPQKVLSLVLEVYQAEGFPKNSKLPPNAFSPPHFPFISFLSFLAALSLHSVPSYLPFLSSLFFISFFLSVLLQFSSHKNSAKKYDSHAISILNVASTSFCHFKCKKLAFGKLAKSVDELPCLLLPDFSQYEAIIQ